MRDIEDKISFLVQSQFPSFYLEDGPNFVEFVKEYYRFLEDTNNPLFYTRNLLEYRDIDKTIDDFVVHFKEKYLKYFPLDLAVDDTRFLVKHIMDFYRSKGSARSYEIFFRSVYNATPTIYYPSEDVFKLSDGTWYKPIYLELSPDAANVTNLLQKQVYGASTGAVGFGERLVKKRVAGKYVDILYVTGVIGAFEAGEVITLQSNPLIDGYPRLLGSLSSVDVITGGAGFAVGDLINIQDGQGSGGVIRVTEVSSETGVVSFSLVDGGFGFTTGSQVLISTKVLDVAGNSQSFQLFETISQPMANIQFISANAIFANGETVVSYYSNGSQAGNGVILVVSHESNTQTGSMTISTVSGNVAAGDTPASGQFYKSGNTKTAIVNVYTSTTATGNLMGQNTTSIGVINVVGTFVTSNNNYIIGGTSNVTSSVSEIGLGTGASFSIGSISNPENVRLDATFLRDRNVGNVAYMSIRLDSSNSNASGNTAFGFPVYPGGDINTILLNCFDIDDYTIGTIASLTSVDGGQDYTKTPFVRVFEYKTAGHNKKDIILKLANTTSNFAVGELVEQSSNTTAKVLTINNFSGNTAVVVGEYVYQSDGVSNVATGYVYNASITLSGSNTGTITVSNVSGTFTNSYNIQTLTSSASANVVSIANTTITTTAIGAVKQGSNTTTLFVKRLSFFDTFAAGNTAIGKATGAQGTITYVDVDANSYNIGNNSIISANVTVANGTVISAEVYNSGVGYQQDEVLTGVNAANVDSAMTAKLNVITQGTGEGYYRSTKSFLSNDKYLFDGTYYQDFSYDIRSAVPFDKYKDVLKQVIHVAGTQMFGTYVDQVQANVTITSTSNTTIIAE